MASTRRTTSELCTSTTMSPCEATPEMCHLINACTRKQVASKHEPCPALAQMILYRLSISSCMTTPHTCGLQGLSAVFQTSAHDTLWGCFDNTVSMHAWP